MDGEGNQNLSRRDFLDRCLMLSAGASVLLFFSPVPGYLSAEPPEDSNANTAPIPESELKEGDARAVFYRGRPALVIKTKEGVHAVSAVCTHLGCVVKWKEGAIHCPCHGARFDANGKKLQGPARSDLATIPVSLQESKYILGR